MSKEGILPGQEDDEKDALKSLIEMKNDPSIGEKGLADHIYKNGQILNQTAVGELLGNIKHQGVLKQYTEQFNFTDKAFFEAMKMYLDKFKLPGEGQQIERIMDNFSKMYFEDNKDRPGNKFAHEDATGVLAYAIIMLNTDLHNPAQKKKMTEDEFIRNLKGLNKNSKNDDKVDFEPEFLKGIYAQVKTNPIPQKIEVMVSNILEKTIENRYKEAQVKKIPIIGRFKMVQNPTREGDKEELQNALNELNNAKNDPERMKQDLDDLQKKMDDLEIKISAQSKWMGQSRLKKAIKDLRQEIAPLIKENERRIPKA